MRCILAAIAALWMTAALPLTHAQSAVTIAISPAGSGTLTAGKNGSCSVGTNAIVALDCIETAAPGYKFLSYAASAPVWCIGSTNAECGPYAITGPGGTLTANFVATSTTVTPPPATTASSPFCANDPNPNCGESLTWNVPATSADPIVGYQVFRGSGTSSNFVQLTTTPLTAAAYTDKTIAGSSSYQYYVVSVDAAGIQSTPTNTISVAIGATAASAVPASPSGLAGSLVQ